MKVHWLETYKSLITLSIEGFKFSALANGGSAVALLAYLGNVARNDLLPVCLINPLSWNGENTLRLYSFQ